LLPLLYSLFPYTTLFRSLPPFLRILLLSLLLCPSTIRLLLKKLKHGIQHDGDRIDQTFFINVEIGVVVRIIRFEIRIAGPCIIKGPRYPLKIIGEVLSTEIRFQF